MRDARMDEESLPVESSQLSYSSLRSKLKSVTINNEMRDTGM